MTDFSERPFEPIYSLEVLVELEVEGRGVAGRITADAPPSSDPLSRWNNAESERVIIAHYRDELAEYRGRVRFFVDLQPDEVMMEISAIAARLAEIRSDLIDAKKTRADDLRTKHLDPLRADLEFQFKIASRRLATMEFDLGMTRGMT